MALFSYFSMPNNKQSSGLDLTFRKWFVNFPNENNQKLSLNFVDQGWSTKRIFPSKSTETAINSIGISISFLSYWITSDLYLILEDFC